VDIFGIGSALSIEGVEDVDMSSPAADIEVSLTQAPFCTAINLTVEVDHG
jgi:phage-related baseplate assembly protein